MLMEPESIYTMFNFQSNLHGTLHVYCDEVKIKQVLINIDKKWNRINARRRYSYNRAVERKIMTASGGID